MRRPPEEEQGARPWETTLSGMQHSVSGFSLTRLGTFENTGVEAGEHSDLLSPEKEDCGTPRVQLPSSFLREPGTEKRRGDQRRRRMVLDPGKHPCGTSQQ